MKNTTIKDELSHPWNAPRFITAAGNWAKVLQRPEESEKIRRSMLKRIDERAVYGSKGAKALHVLDRVVIRDSARALRSILSPRNEHVVGFQVLQAMIDAANGVDRPDLGPAFWADLTHLIEGVRGNAVFHTPYHLEFAKGLSGREAAILRSSQLDHLAALMEEQCARFPSGLSQEARKRRRKRQQEIQQALGASDSEFHDWHWQLRNIARNLGDLKRMARLSDEEKQQISQLHSLSIPFGVTPYYASLFDNDYEAGRDRAIRMQVLPPKDYIHALRNSDGADDYMLENDTSPVDLITRRYARNIIFKPYNACPQICVYCQRNWEIQGPMDPKAMAGKQDVHSAISWIASRPAIEDVLVTGGDPLVLSDNRLKHILDGLCAIPHIRRIRIGSRMPVTLPMRLTPALCNLLGSYRIPGEREICLVTHIEHPYEITPELLEVVERIRLQGIPVYNQLVYTFFVSRRFEAVTLRRLLRRCGIEPYYTFNTKGKDETISYRVPIARLVQEQKEEARILPGLSRTDEAVFNVPGLGKNPLNAWQHRDLISILPDGARAYEFHPWEKKIEPQRTYIFGDIPILDYLKRLATIGEDVEAYRGIWYYF